MGFKVQFENGHTVEFETKPSDSDIDEAYQTTLKLPKKESAKAPVQQETPSMFDFLTGSARKGFAQSPTAGGLQKGAQAVASELEAGAAVGSGLAGMVGGVAPAALKNINNITQGQDTNFEQDYANAIDRFTYQPRTEVGQELTQMAGEFINRNLVPLGPMGGTLGPVAGALERPGRIRGTSKKAGANPAGFAEEFNAKSAPVDLSKVDTKNLDIDLTQGGDAGGRTINMNAKGQGYVTDPVTEMARRQQEERPPLADSPDTTLMKQEEMFGNPDLFELGQDKMNAKPPMEPAVKGEQLPLFEDADFFAMEKPEGVAEPRKGLEAASEELQRLKEEDAQRKFNERQMDLEFEVKKQQSLDFNAAERGRQEKAPVPGLENHLAEQAYQEHLAKVQADPRVVKAEQRAAKAQELVAKAQEQADAGKLDSKILKRLQKDLDGLKEAADFVRSNVEYENLTNARKANRIKNDTYRGKQRGAVDASGLFKTLEEISDKIKKLKTSEFYKNVDEAKQRALEAPLLEDRKTAYDALNAHYTKQRDTLGKISPGGRQTGAIILEGNKKKALGNLATKLGIEEKLGELAPSQWTPEQAIEFAKNAKDLDQNFVQKSLNLLTKGGLYMSLKTHNPMVRYVVENILSSDRKARAEIRDVVHKELGPAIRDMSTKEQAEVWSAIELADLNQKPIDVEMLARHGYNEKQIRAVETHRQAMEHGYDMLNKAREAAGKEPIEKRVAYAAMRATGDFRRLVYIGDEVVGVIGSDFRKGVDKLAKGMEEKGFTVGEERYFGGMPKERGSANQAFMHAIEMLAENDPKMQHFVDVLNDIRTTEVYNFLNAKTHTMDKKGVFGMEGRKPWETAEQNAADGFKAQLNYLESSIKWGHLSDAATNIKKVLDAKEVNMPEAKKWSERYLYNALGFNPSEVGRGVEQSVAGMFKEMGVGYSIGREAMAGARAITNGLLLSLNPRFWATNVVQPLQAMPAMKAMLITRGLDAGFDFGTGYSYLAEGAATAMKKNTGQALSSFEQQAFKYAYNNHVYGSDMIEHSNRVRKDALYRANQVGNFVAGDIESSTRQMMFYSFAHMLKENGMTMDKGIFEAAHNLTDIAMNNYSSVERPQIYNSLGPVGDIAVNLQSYKHNELSRLALFARHAQEHKSLRPVMTQLASGLAFGGILGTVAFAEADQIYKAFTKHVLGKPDSLTNLVIKMSEDKTGGHLASHGMFSALGLDMTKSLGLTDVVPDNLMDAAFPGGSKLAEVAGAGYDLATNPSEMNAKRFGRAASPIATQGALDNAWFTQDTEQGKLSLNKDNLRGQAYRNNTDYWAKNFGFTGVNESVQRQKTYNIEKVSRDYADLRQKPLNNMRDELFSKGQISQASVEKYLKYQGNPETLISDLERYDMEQHMSAKELALLRNSASSAVGALMKAQEYLRMFSNENEQRR